MYANAYYRNNEGAWCYLVNDLMVQGADDYYTEGSKLEMSAPELLVHQMLDTDGVAALVRIDRKSVSRMLSRGSMPLQQIRLAGSPLWSKEVIRFWLNDRPGKGAHLRNRGKKAE